MIGYEYAEKVWLAPPSGQEQLIDFRTSFRDVPGAQKIEVGHRIDVEEIYDVNKCYRPAFKGPYLDAKFTLSIGHMEDQRDLARIVNALRAAGWVVYLSLDGGTTRYAVGLVKYTGPTPIGGMPRLGGTYTLDVRSTNELEEIPAIGYAGHV